MKKFLIAISVVLILCGCSTSGSGDVKTPRGASDPTASVQTEQPSGPETTPEVATPESVAEKIGVVDYTMSSSVAPFAAQWGEGTYEGSRIQIYAFGSEDDYISFLEQIKQFGIVESQLVRTEMIVVAVDDQTKTEDIRTALGAE